MKKNLRIAAIMAFDIIALYMSSILAIAIRFEFLNIPATYMKYINQNILIDILIMIIVFFLFKMYQSVWKLASVFELVNVGISCFIFEIITLVYKTLFNINMPRSYYIIQLMLLIFFICSIRFGYRIARVINEHYRNSKDQKNTMLVGAGQAGNMIIREIINNPTNFQNKIRCVIDDNHYKKGKYIHGIPIIGDRSQILSGVKKYRIEEIVIAIPSISQEELNKIVLECRSTKCVIKVLPKLNSILGTASMSNLTTLSYDDFLGRREIKINNDEIASVICNKTVIVTGGGGSIGSELCRKIASYNPKRLIIVDIYENTTYDIQQELIRDYPDLLLDVVIASVRDYDRIDSIFKKYRPDYVFHAAAHKHVPLMEENCMEAIKNNCVGTLNVAKAADKYKVKKFVLISTDKAVNPTNLGYSF